MKVYSNAGGIAQTNCFLVADEKAKVAVLFDAPDHTVGPLLDEAQKQGWDIIGLWLTHGHFDHMADHAEVTQRFPKAKVLVHKLDEVKIEHPNSQFPLPITIPPASASEYVEDGQKLAIGSLAVEVLHTPGHSSGHVMYYFPQEKIIVGGDLIIMGAVGRTDLPDSSYAVLQESIRRVMKLPGDTTLLPGHGDPSTLAQELQSNEYVRKAVGRGK